MISQFEIIENIYGKFLINKCDLISRHISVGDFWDDCLIKPMEKFCNIDSISIDIGAHVGFHSVFMSKMSYQVFSFEPQKILFYNLCSNLLLNQVVNVRPFNSAAYDEIKKFQIVDEIYQPNCVPRLANGRVNYFPEKIIEANHISSGVVMRSDPNYGGLGIISSNSGDIESHIIDNFFFEKRVSFIKCDAQGSDFRALNGCKDIIKKDKPVIIFEYEGESNIHNYKFQDFEQLMDGYNINQISQTNFIAEPS